MHNLTKENRDNTQKYGVHLVNDGM